MQLFRLPNRKQVYGVNFERVGSRPPSPQGPQQQREYMDLERQLRGVTALSDGLAGRRRPALGKMDVVRPGMHDRIDGVSILGGLSLRHANGRPLSLLFMSDPNTMYRQRRQMEFCVMKVPSQGAWTAQQEFVMSRGEYDLVLALLPVICDPGYEGSRTEGLAEVTKRFAIMPSSMSAIPSTDGPALSRFCSDSMGRPVFVPSESGSSSYDGDEWDEHERKYGYDDDDEDERERHEEGYDKDDRDETGYHPNSRRGGRGNRRWGRRDRDDSPGYDDHDDSVDSSKYYDPRDVYADPYADRRQDDEQYDGYDGRFDMGDDAYRIPDRPPRKKASPMILVIVVVLLIVLTFVAILIHNMIAPQIGLG